MPSHPPDTTPNKDVSSSGGSWSLVTSGSSTGSSTLSVVTPPANLWSIPSLGFRVGILIVSFLSPFSAGFRAGILIVSFLSLSSPSFHSRGPLRMKRSFIRAANSHPVSGRPVSAPKVTDAALTSVHTGMLISCASSTSLSITS
jgi:hypothetical protein